MSADVTLLAVRAIGVVCVLACGCNEVFGIKPTKLKLPDGAPDAIGCSGSTFSGLAPFPYTLADPMNPASEPTLSGDLGELWFDQRGLGGHAQIYFATGSPGAGYSGDSPAPFIDQSGVQECYGAALTEDGLHLAFIRDNAAWEVSRAAIGAPFSEIASPLGSLDVVNSIALNRTGLVAYFSRGGEIYSAARAKLMDDFMPAVDLGVAGHNPTISPDELELFYDTTAQADANIERRVRTSVDAPFAAPELIQTNAYEPSITFDSRTLLMVQSSTPVLMQMTRTCP